MRWIAEPDMPNLSPRAFYLRTNALTQWLDWCAHRDALDRAPSWCAWVLGRVQAGVA